MLLFVLLKPWQTYQFRIQSYSLLQRMDWDLVVQMATCYCLLTWWQVKRCFCGCNLTKVLCIICTGSQSVCVCETLEPSHRSVWVAWSGDDNKTISISRHTVIRAAKAEAACGWWWKLLCNHNITLRSLEKQFRSWICILLFFTLCLNPWGENTEVRTIKKCSHVSSSCQKEVVFLISQ